MADIVDFRAVPGKRPAPFRSGQVQSAEIVIFPGVRYERWDEKRAEAPKPELKGAAPKKSRKKRDTLELVDA